MLQVSNITEINIVIMVVLILPFLLLLLTLILIVVILLRMAAPHSCTTAGTGTTGEMKPGEGPKQTPPGRLADPRGQHPVEKYASPIPKARAIRYAGIGRGSQPLEIFNAPRIRETKLRDMKCRVNSRPGGRSKAGTPLQIGHPHPHPPHHHHHLVPNHEIIANQMLSSDTPKLAKSLGNGMEPSGLVTWNLGQAEAFLVWKLFYDILRTSHTFKLLAHTLPSGHATMMPSFLMMSPVSATNLGAHQIIPALSQNDPRLCSNRDCRSTPPKTNILNLRQP